MYNILYKIKVLKTYAVMQYPANGLKTNGTSILILNQIST